MSILKHNLRAGFLFGFAMIFVNFSAAAQDTHDALTDDNITAFIEKTTELTSGQETDATTDEIKTFLKNHLDEDARFKSSITFNIPGFPPQKKSLTLNKKEFIEHTEAGAQSLDDYETTVLVEKIRISKDGKKATVETSGYENGMMPISTDGVNTQKVPVEGESSCFQIIKLTDNGVIQMYSAKCKTEIQFQEY